VRQTLAEPPAAPAGRPGPWRSPGVLLAAGVALLILVVLAVAVALAVGTRQADDAWDGGGRVVSGPLDDRREAMLELVDGATSITIRTVDLGDDLYRVSTPDGSHLRPRVDDRGGVLRVGLAENGPPGESAVEVRLNPRVRWAVRLTGGANDEVVDLTGGRLAELAIAGGVARVEIVLPAASGTVPVRLSGGADQVLLRVPAGAPVRVQAGAGAGTVTVDGTVHSGVAAGAVFEPPGWAGARDRYDVTASKGVGSLTVERR
jgi:hypothetical protein